MNPILGLNPVNSAATNFTQYPLTVKPLATAPTSQKTATTNNTTGGTVISGVNDPGTIKSYDQAIANSQDAVNRLPGQRDASIANTQTSYRDALQTLLGGYNDSKSTFDKNVLSSKNDYVSSKNTIGANAGSTLSGLLRLLGSRGAGGGSAANIAAPDAVGRQATLQRNDVSKTFADNQDALNSNWFTYDRNYNNSVKDVGRQRDTNLSTIQDSFSTNKASLLQTIAQLASQRDQAAGGTGTAVAAPYLAEANALLDKVGTTRVAPINYQVGTYNSPNLAKYITGTTTPTYQGQSQSNDYFSPSLSALLGKKQLIGA